MVLLSRSTGAVDESVQDRHRLRERLVEGKTVDKEVAALMRIFFIIFLYPSASHHRMDGGMMTEACHER